MYPNQTNPPFVSARDIERKLAADNCNVAGLSGAIGRAAPPPDMVREIPHELQQLSEAIVRLHHNAQALRERLSPALASQPEEKDACGKAEITPATQLGERLRQMRHEVNCATASLEMLERTAQL